MEATAYKIIIQNLDNEIEDASFLNVHSLKMLQGSVDRDYTMFTGNSNNVKLASAYIGGSYVRILGQLQNKPIKAKVALAVHGSEAQKQCPVSITNGVYNEETGEHESSITRPAKLFPETEEYVSGRTSFSIRVLPKEILVFTMHIMEQEKLQNQTEV